MASYSGTRYVIIEGTFEELFLEAPLSKAISSGLELNTLSPIQREALPALLEGKDAILSAKTGSGKTLAFLIPIVQNILDCGGFPSSKGTSAIILSPTRELADQTFVTLEVLTSACKSRISIAVIRGGAERLKEEQMLQGGISVIVATPGRLLDHMRSHRGFQWNNLQTLVLDEADQLLEQGFEKDILQIIQRLPVNRQTILVSATIHKNTENFAKQVLKPDHSFFSVCETIQNASHMGNGSSSHSQSSATVQTLQQFYHVCRSQYKFHILYTFLKMNEQHRCIVFMATCLQVAYFYELLSGLKLSVKSIHSRMEQSKRTKNHGKFLQKKVNILLCTDIAARGLHFPDVDWIVQFDPPRDYKQYIHRVGRTARAGSSGQALLLLQPHEKRGFLEELARGNVCLEELKLSGNVHNIQSILETIVSEDKELYQMAVRALKSYLQSYAYHALACFRSKKLDLDALARMHGLKQTPRLCKGFKKAKA